MNRLLIGLLVLLGTTPHAQPVPERDRVPVLAELFTSEGCNSCPPADRLLEMLLKEQPLDDVYVVGLSEHVTYWDRQGWKDPFGSPRFTERQNAYAFRFSLDGSFTPQLVVDGGAQMIGSDTNAIRSALVNAGHTPKQRLKVDVSLTDRDTVTASVTGPGLAVDAAERAELLWAVTEDNLVVDVTRGENANRTLRHSGVVRSLVVQKIDRATRTMSVPVRLHADWKLQDLRVVAFVQSTKSKRVLAVGWTQVPPAP